MSELEDAVNDEIQTISGLLADLNPADSFIDRIVQTQMERRSRALESQLDAMQNRTLELHFDDANMPNRQALATNTVAQILSRVQTSLTFGTWAMSAGPGIAGTPPASIEKSARTEVVATPPGSFRLVLRKQSVEIEPAFEESIGQILDVADAAFSDRLDAEGEAIVETLGREATRRLELLFKKLADEELDTSFEWSSPNSKRSVFVSHGVAGKLSYWLAQSLPTLEVVVVTGHLRRADTLSGAFKIEDQATGKMCEGSGDPEILAHAVMDTVYEAQIERETSSSVHTGRVVEKLRLLALNRPGAQLAP